MEIKNWLTKGGSLGIDFSQELDLLKAIVLLEKNLDADDADSDLEDVVQALDALAYGDPDAAKVRELLKENELDVDALAGMWLKLRKGVLKQFPDTLKALGYRLVDLASDVEDLPKTLIEWTPLDEGGRIPFKDQVELQVNLSGIVCFEALPKSLPKAYPSTLPKPHVRIGIKGSLSAGVNAKLPINWGGVSSDAGASAETQLNWYFRNVQTILFASALARDIRRLRSPFDLDGIAELSRRHIGGRSVSPKLAGVQMVVNGKLGFGGEIELTDAVALVTGVAGIISAKVGFRVQRGGEYRYFVYQDEGLAISLYRDRFKGDKISTSLGLELDFTPLLDRLKDLLKPGLGQLPELLDKMRDVLSHDEKARDTLAAAIGKALDGSAQGQILKGQIGFDAERSAGDVLGDRIMTEVETSTARWSVDAKTAAAQVADALIARMHIPAPQAEELRKLIEKQAQGLISKEVKRLSDWLKRLVKDDGEFKALGGILGSLGNPVDTGVDETKRIDQVLEPVRRQLTRYQGQVKKFRDVLERTVEAKLKAKITAEEERMSGVSADLQFRFRYLDDTAKSVYRKVMTGSLEEAFRLLREQPGDGPIELISGELANYASLDRKSGYGISLLGYGVAGSRSLGADLEYVSDSNGDIRVTSKTAIQQCRNDWEEGRCLSFVNVYSLASASRTNQLQLSLTLNQNDKKVEPDDVRGFFQDLEKGGLLRSGATRSAMGFYDSQLDTNPLSDLTGKLETGFSLGAEQIRTLLGVDEAGVQIRPDEAVLNLAIDELLPIVGEAVRLKERFIDDVAKKRIKKYFPQLDPSLSGDLKQAIARLDDQTASLLRGKARLVIRGDDEIGVLQLERDIDNVNCYYQHAEHIREMVKLLRKVYLSGRTPGSWSKEKYAKAQEDLDGYLRFWVNVDSKWLFLIPDRIRPFTIAFIRILAQLAGLPLGEAGRSLVSAKLTVGGKVVDLTRMA